MGSRIDLSQEHPITLGMEYLNTLTLTTCVNLAVTFWVEYLPTFKQSNQVYLLPNKTITNWVADQIKLPFHSNWRETPYACPHNTDVELGYTYTQEDALTVR